MELGEKLRLARQERGLSQRQLCADVITRNMLSLLENGSASPSLETLRYLAGRLDKPLSYFFDEENTVSSDNQTILLSARQQFYEQDYSAALESLKELRLPDEPLAVEYALLQTLSLLALAQELLAKNRQEQAQQLLAQAEAAEEPLLHCLPELRTRRLLLAAQLPDADWKAIAAQLPPDPTPMLRAQAALADGAFSRAAALLDTAEERSSRWQLLRGQAYFGLAQYRQAIDCLTQAETAFPATALRLLEQCYKELEDYRMAYEYACRQREQGAH